MRERFNALIFLLLLICLIIPIAAVVVTIQGLIDATKNTLSGAYDFAVDALDAIATEVQTLYDGVER